MQNSVARITIIGTGSWGTALALTCHRAGNHVAMVARSQQQAEQINRTHTTPHLPDITLPEEITAHTANDGLPDADYIIIACPAQAVRDVIKQMKQREVTPRPLIIAAKGIEAATGKLMQQVAREEGWPDETIYILSGPNFAGEVAKGLPAASIISGKEKESPALLRLFYSRHFRPYYTSDRIGVQLGGAIKNVIAIAAGITIGAGMGENGRAAMITRGNKEIMRLSKAMGAQPETLAGLSGMGDLLLSCTSPQSRNYTYGMQLAADGKNHTHLTEGIATAQAVHHLAQQYEVEMPICETVYQMLHADLTINEAKQALLARPTGHE